jgi:hypothetical protein
MKWTFEHPALVPLTIKNDDGTPLIHNRLTRYSCMDLNCPCHDEPESGTLLRRYSAKLRAIEQAPTERFDELTVEQDAMLQEQVFSNEHWPRSIPLEPAQTEEQEGTYKIYAPHPHRRNTRLKRWKHWFLTGKRGG